MQVALNTLVTLSPGTSGASRITPNLRMIGLVIAMVPRIVICTRSSSGTLVQGITLGSVKE